MDPTRRSDGAAEAVHGPSAESARGVFSAAATATPISRTQLPDDCCSQRQNGLRPSGGIEPLQCLVAYGFKSAPRPRGSVRPS